MESIIEIFFVTASSLCVSRVLRKTKAKTLATYLFRQDFGRVAHHAQSRLIYYCCMYYTAAMKILRDETSQYPASPLSEDRNVKSIVLWKYCDTRTTVLWCSASHNFAACSGRTYRRNIWLISFRSPAVHARSYMAVYLKILKSRQLSRSLRRRVKIDTTPLLLPRYCQVKYRRVVFEVLHRQTAVKINRLL